MAPEIKSDPAGSVEKVETDTDTKMRVLCVLPTYNEAENIGWIVRDLLDLELGVDIIVIDDASPDGTADEARGAGPPERVRVAPRNSKQGLGSAHRLGMAAGVKGGYDRVVVMDADGSHPPDRVPALVAATIDCDLSIGSRYVSGGAIVNWPLGRLVLSRGANLMARFILGGGVHDWTSAFRCYRVSLLAELELDRFHSDGYAFVEEMLFECVSRGARTAEVPITFIERRAGRSKIDRVEILVAVWRLFALGVKRLI